MLAHGTHLLMRICVHGAFDFGSYSDLPKLGFDSPVHYHIWMGLSYGLLGLAGVSLVLSAFSFRRWWPRILYVIVLGTVGLFIAFMMVFSYICDTGIDCM